jgi:DNA-binding NtrC family response regulator
MNATATDDIKPAMSDRRSTVLHVSPDTAQARSRHEALTSIGYYVVCVQTVTAALFEISMGRCGILLLCHKLDHTGRCTLAEFFHKNCPDPYIVAVLAHEHDHYSPQVHVCVIHAQDHGPLVTVMRRRLSAA